MIPFLVPDIRTLLLLIFILFLLPSVYADSTEDSRSGSKPNIVLIMADDMGYSDIGSYGSEIRTPNIDALADGGLRYTQFYNNARCVPTRASLLTGMYPHKTGLGWMTVRDLGTEGYSGDLNEHGITIATALKQAGYASYMSGKWHLTLDEYATSGGPKQSWPMQRGFDSFYGTILGSGSYFDPATLAYDNEIIEPEDPGFYYTDAISDTAASFIREHSQSGRQKPFFLYVAYTAPHWPLHAKPADIKKYENQYMTGWDSLRARRFKKMKELGVIDQSTVLSRRDGSVPAWNSLDKKEQRDYARRMAIYAAQITSMDEGIGRIIESLKRTGAFKNTLILFLADNGGCAEYISNGDTSVEALGSARSFESYREPWANASDTPFRLYKHWVHEGGISTPLIAHWPVGIKDGGTIRNQPGHVIDIMATSLDLAGAEYPKKFGGRSIRPLDGKSLVPTFTGEGVDREAIYWEHEANRAIRMGKWKLVSTASHESPFINPWELYDISRDRSEVDNLADRYPQKVQQMAELWQKWAHENYVYPLDGRSWNERLENPKAISEN